MHEGWRCRRHVPVAIEFPIARRLLLRSLAAGGCIVFANSGDRLHLLELLHRFGVEQVTLSPRRVETLMDEAGRGAALPWPEQCGLTLTGAPAPGALRARIQSELTRNLYIAYGTVECGYISLAGPGDHALHPEGVGRPCGSEVVVTDESGRHLPPGETGFIRVRSPGIAAGYLDDPAATAAAFLPGGWYRTGDIASIAPDGHILFGGRGDDMMILGTINVFPAEIERAAEGFPGVADCAAFALRTQTHGDIPMIAVVETAPGALDAAGLAAHCRARLGLRAPRKVLVVAGIPRNAAGKTLRRDLAAMMQHAASDAPEPAEAPARTGSA
jgi:long-chain acyl-CoA synthetase